MMQKLRLLNINAKWLFLGWVVISLLLNTLFYTSELGSKYLIYENNKNPDWCNRYSYYLTVQKNTSRQCLLECWSDFGCDANATGVFSEDNCLCNGFNIKPTAWKYQNKEWWLQYDTGIEIE